MDRFITRKRLNEEKIDDPDVITSTSSTAVDESVDSSLKEIDLIPFKYLFNEFFMCKSVISNKIIASCQNCSKVVCGSTTSSGNFLSHIKLKHRTLMSKVNDARKKNDSVQINKQPKIYDAPVKKISKELVKNLVFDYVVNEMRPLVTCEKKSFQNLILGLTRTNDTSIIPNRKQLSSQLESNYTMYVTMLTDLIKKQKYVCATADIWSANNRSYMGMTCHFIDALTYKRQSYVLGCKRIKGSHNYQNIAETLTEITQKYAIDHSKITHIVTDNATNFGKAFRLYSTPLTTTTSDLTERTPDFGNFDESSSDGLVSDDEFDCFDFNLETVNLSNFFPSQSNPETSDDISLPQHMLCCSHTLNLIAASDISKVSNAKYNKISKSAFNKLSQFWNLASRSTAASDKIFDICKCKFPVPVVTRWNSLYDATQKVLNHKQSIILIFQELRLSKLKVEEWVFIEEYCSVMKPLAFSLDKLQNEKKSCLGYVAPTILVLRKLLIQSTGLLYCKPLSNIIINSLETRFNYLFDLSDPKSKSFIMASISHPKFKLSWVPIRYKDMCKKLFFDECNTFSITKNNSSDTIDGDSDSSSDQEFYSNLKVPIPMSPSSSFNSSDTRQANITSMQVLNYLNSNKKDLDSLDEYPLIKEIFFKYNTTLPSSAPVERLFSGAIQVLTSRRNRLSDKTFDMLLCCRQQL